MECPVGIRVPLIGRSHTGIGGGEKRDSISPRVSVQASVGWVSSGDEHLSQNLAVRTITRIGLMQTASADYDAARQPNGAGPNQTAASQERRA